MKKLSKNVIWMSSTQLFCYLQSLLSYISMITHLVGCEEFRLSALPRCLLKSTSSVCTWAASWKWAPCPSTGGGKLAPSTCTRRRVAPGAAGFQQRRHRSRRPAWSGPLCKCSCTRPQTRSSFLSWEHQWQQSVQTLTRSEESCCLWQKIYNSLRPDLRSHCTFLPDSS